MKFLLTAILLASQAPVAEAQQTIIFEEETTTTRRSVTVINGGMEVPYERTRHYRPRREFTAGTVRIGSDVITSDNRRGTVVAMFRGQDKIVVRDSYYGNRNWSLSNIAVTNGWIGPFCVGDNVITSDNRSGTIEGYFANGNLVVRDSYYGNRTWNQSNVGFAFGCTDEFCVGDSVITSDNRNGIVAGFFGNGNVVVKDSYYGNRTWSPDRIAMTQAVCGNIFVRRVNYCY